MSHKNIEITDPFEYLEEDHTVVSDLLTKLEDSTENAIKTRTELFEKLNEALTLHALLEEKTLYPALEEVKTTHDITMEAFEEHHVAKILLAELADGDPETEEWTAKIKVLKENIEHHVEEEEDNMFTKARKALTQEQQDKLAQEMQTFLQNQ